jgi:hypothetical protein
VFWCAAVCAEAAKEKDLNNNRIHNIFRLALYSTSALDSTSVNGLGFELLLRHSFEYELFNFGEEASTRGRKKGTRDL